MWDMCIRFRVCVLCAMHGWFAPVLRLHISLTVQRRGDEAPPQWDSGKITAVIPALADWCWICGGTEK